MATSWVTETKEKVNYTRLCRLLYDGGILALRTVFDGICPPAYLRATLTHETNQSKLKKLKKPAGKVLSQKQWDLLYPPSGASPKSENFDITLLFVLLRNICGLTPPATKWDDLPPITDKSLEANLVRIKFYRNNITAHSSKAEVDDKKFDDYWRDISVALVSLGLKQDDIDELKSSPLGACSKLAHINFTSLIQSSCKVYHQSTRQWIFNQIEETVQKTSSGASVVLIRAGPGMGKSVVAAKTCDIYQKRGFLGGCHFFQHSNSLRNNPRIMLQSIARQLCNSLNGYQAALETKLKTLQGRNISDLNCEELFGLLFEEPLSQICIDHNVVIVIDAFDECASQFKEELEDVLNGKLSDLPSWIRFVITTRPLPSCRYLSPVFQIEIDPSESINLQDLKEFCSFKLAEQNAEHLIDKVMEISNGLFLVAHFVLEILDEVENESDILECFPHGISSVYKYYFTRIQKIIKPYIHISESEDDSFFKMLEAMVAAKSPIPKKMFYEILKLKSVEEVQRAKRMERNDALHLLHTIFPVENDHVNVFHKSVTDWLNLDGENEHQFSVSASNGCEKLAQKSLDVLKVFKNAAKEGRKPFDQPLVLSDSGTFALRFGLEFINKSSKLSQFEKEEIIYDFYIVAAILGYLGLYVYEQLGLLNSLYGDFDFGLMDIYLQSYNTWLVKVPNEWDFNDRKLLFGQCLNIAGDVCSSRNIDVFSTAQKQELLRLRIKQKLPYYTFHPVVSSLSPALQLRPWSSSSDDDEASLGFFEITNGFIAVNFDPGAEPPTSTVNLNIKDDGSFAKHKTFSSAHDVRGVSPDKKFLIITKTPSSKIELFDVTTHEKVKEYNCPINCIGSCHIFGDEQWYIVMKAPDDPKIHILDGLNGQLHDTIEVGENEDIVGGSQCGHILICDTSDLSCVKIYTIHFKKTDEKIYYNPLSDDTSERPKVFKFSDDGKYFALYYDNLVYLFQTNDGTLLKSIQAGIVKQMVFLSFPCLIIRVDKTSICNRNDSCLLFYDFINNKVIYVAPINLTYQSRLLVSPQHHTDKSIISLFVLKNDGLVKYEFHNLEQNL